MSWLTKSQETYLHTIYDLGRGADGVRLTDIANRLDVSKASVCAAMAKLEARGFVVRGAGRLIALTPDGAREAKRVLDNFTVVHLFLTRKLNVDSHTALMDAGALEHVVSEQTVHALRSLLE
jgi:Mn-dependent DtxR family transcriptional regulator